MLIAGQLSFLSAVVISYIKVDAVAFARTN
jgi:hypothetical protein